MAGRRRDWLLALFVIGCLAFNYPLLGLFDRLRLPLGLPLLYLYLYGFIVVVGVILAVAMVWLSRSGRSEADDD